jgi:hypothetical protein
MTRSFLKKFDNLQVSLIVAQITDFQNYTYFAFAISH